MMNPTSRSLLEENASEEVVDFSAAASYAHTKPTSFLYAGRLVSCGSWRELFYNVVKLLYHDYEKRLPINQTLPGGSRVYLGSHVHMIQPQALADGLSVESNMSANEVVTKLGAILDYSDLPRNLLTIRYRRKVANSKAATSTPRPSSPAELQRLIVSKFSRVFRLNSTIEFGKLRRLAKSENVSLPESDGELKKELCSLGYVFQRQLFVVDSDFVARLLREIKTLFDSGVGVLFFEPFFEERRDELARNHIFSSQLLREILKRERPRYYHSANFMTPRDRKNEKDAILDEIRRVAGDQRVLLLSELETQLDHIPREKLRHTVSRSRELLHIGDGKYFWLSALIISDEEAATIREFVATRHAENGYASLADVPLGEMENENYELSVSAIHHAIYARVLEGEYRLHGKILTNDASDFNLRQLLKDFCKARSECAVSEVFDHVFELTGSESKRTAAAILMDLMIRADKGRFVADDQASFDVEAIDALLAERVGDGFAPLKSVVSFALFPVCGVPWNHYLLESYCHRFSEQYKLSVLSFNNRNVGFVVSKRSTASYVEMASQVVANSGIVLTETAIGEYLVDNGVLVNSTHSLVPDVQELAKRLRGTR